MRRIVAGLWLLAGFVAGWMVATLWPSSETVAVPEAWVARIDGEYISVDTFLDEMRRRGGTVPGQFRDPEQKRALLDTLLYQRALLRAAEEEGMLEDIDVRRSREQILVNHYLQQTLRRRQQEVSVSAEEVGAFHAEQGSEYTIPARRRVAMIHIPVPEGADDSAWQRARELAAEALDKAQNLNGAVGHFGAIAREYSHDNASRYRGGVIGWVAEGQAERYRYDPAFLEAAYALTEPGEFSAVLDGADGVYLARLVELEPARERSLDELSAGIQQRLLREKLAASEQAFRDELMRRYTIEVREDALDAIDPMSPPAGPDRPQPPAMPRDEG
jgi:parvulin-like peptidyl-prolyl isomerase